MKYRIDSLNEVKIDNLLQKSFQNLDKIIKESPKNDSEPSESKNEPNENSETNSASREKSPRSRPDENNGKKNDKTEIPQMVHNNFYNKFNEELFDDENML